MSVPLKFAAGDACAVDGQRGRVRAIAGQLATVELGDSVVDLPLSSLDVALPRLGPTVKRGTSRQDWETPPEFMRAVVKRFGPIIADLAASAENCKGQEYINELQDSLKQPWAARWPTGNLWLNPPFGNVEPWAAKCSVEAPKRTGLILFLTPASVGSNWFACHVQRQAMVLALNGRIRFVGAEDDYPRDLQLAVFGFGFHGFDTWGWKR